MESTQPDAPNDATGESGADAVLRGSQSNPQAKPRPLEPREASTHPQAREVLVALGLRLQRARVARDITLADMSERMGVQARTLARLERGAPGVALETLALALWHLNLLEQLGGICAAGADPEGERLAVMRAPRRARGARAVTGGWDTLGRL